VSSLADIAMAFEHVERMQLIPFDKKALLVLITAFAKRLAAGLRPP
jgi:hypothetical protein